MTPTIRWRVAGAQAGKHLLVEKPLCQTREQAIEVAEAVDKAGVKLIVNCKFPHCTHGAEGERADSPSPP